MFQYRRPYRYEDTAKLAHTFLHAKLLFPIASGVRPRHHSHRDVLIQSLALWATHQVALGKEYSQLTFTALRRRFTEALAESALTPPPADDYTRLIDNAIHTFPPEYEVRTITHARTPHNPAPKAYIFKFGEGDPTPLPSQSATPYFRHDQTPRQQTPRKHAHPERTATPTGNPGPRR